MLSEVWEDEDESLVVPLALKSYAKQKGKAMKGTKKEDERDGLCSREALERKGTVVRCKNG